MNLFTIPEAAAYLKLSPKTLQRQVKAGRLGCCRVGRRVTFCQADLDAFTAASRQPAWRPDAIVTQPTVPSRPRKSSPASP